MVLDSSNYATYSDIASAIEYAADHGARIISISIGGSSASSTLQSAVDYAWNKGSVVFAAAMNNSSSTPYYPAACNNVVAISATEPNDTFASFSNYGSWIDLSAPGDLILTTTLGGGYGSWWGTSLATPIAAAVGALALSANPSLTNSGLVSLLKSNSDDLGTPGYDQYFGWGRVNAYKAVLAAKNTQVPTATPPTVSISSPSSGQIVTGAVSVQGTATDNAGVAKIELDVDGVAMATAAGSSSFTFGWNSSSMPNGSHTLTVKAYDANNNMGSASVTVQVSNSTADTIPPVVTIQAPLSGASVSGSVSVQAAATDNVGVTKIELDVDGVPVTTANTTSLSFNWNSTTSTNASHTLTVKAYDAANNAGSASVIVTVANVVNVPKATPPTITITSPVNETSIYSNVNITTVATDSVQVKGVSIYIDTVLVQTCGGNCNYGWNISHYTVGPHTITAKVWDAAGNVGNATPVMVTIPPPSIRITAPLSGAIISSNVNITTAVTDNVQVKGGSIYIDNVLVQNCGGNCNYNWNISHYTAGSHTIAATAWDASGITVNASPVTVTVK